MSTLGNYVIKGACCIVGGIALASAGCVVAETIAIRKKTIKKIQEDKEMKAEDKQKVAEHAKSAKAVPEYAKLAAKNVVEMIKNDPFGYIIAPAWGGAMLLVGNWKGYWNGWRKGWNSGSKCTDDLISVFKSHAPAEFNNMLDTLQAKNVKELLACWSDGTELQTITWEAASCKPAKIIETIAKEVTA